MTSAPKPDPSLDQVTIYRLDHLMFLLVGTIILTSLHPPSCRIPSTGKYRRSTRI